MRLRQAEMVDHHARIGIARRKLTRVFEASRARHVDRQRMLRRRGEDSVDRGARRVG
jgi:hypothetical protein